MKTGDIVTAGSAGVGRPYTLGEVLGRGLWGMTWTARDSVGREYVVKVPLEPGDFPADAAVPDALIDACRAAAQETAALYAQGHPWYPRLEGTGFTHTGGTALVLARYPQSLKRRIAGAIAMSEAVILLQRTLSLLQQAGRRHGDLRPSNVLLTDRGDPILSDPLPHALVPHLHRLSELCGYERDEYLPPEGSSPSSDTFALCAMLYRVAMIGPVGAARDVKREDRVAIPRAGLDKVELATVKDRALTRLKDDKANPRFAPRLAERLAALLNRGLSKETDPSPPYRFADPSALDPRLSEVAELVDPKVDDVGHMLLAASAKNGVFQGGEPATFSVTIACSPGVQGHEDVVCGLQITDLDAPGDGRVRVPETRYGVKPHPSGRLRFDFTLPSIPPGRYRLNVAFSIRDGREEPKVAAGEFEVRPPPGYVPPAEDPPSVPAALSLPQRGVAAPLSPADHDGPSLPGAEVVNLFRAAPAARGGDFPRPLAPSPHEFEPSAPPEAPADVHDTVPAGSLRVAPPPVEAEVEFDPTTGAGDDDEVAPPPVVAPPPLAIVPNVRPSSGPSTSPTIAPPASSPEDPPSTDTPPSWSRPADVDDAHPGAGHDPFLTGGHGAGEDLPSFGGGDHSPKGPSTLSVYVEKLIDLVRRDTYTAFMVFLVVTLGFILFIFALITLL